MMKQLKREIYDDEHIQTPLIQILENANFDLGKNFLINLGYQTRMLVSNDKHSIWQKRLRVNCRQNKTTYQVFHSLFE
jgi:hypothetical protein